MKGHNQRHHLHQNGGSKKVSDFEANTYELNWNLPSRNAGFAIRVVEAAGDAGCSSRIAAGCRAVLHDRVVVWIADTLLRHERRELRTVVQIQDAHNVCKRRVRRLFRMRGPRVDGRGCAVSQRSRPIIVACVRRLLITLA
eukprot:scaffold7454_cov53-Attheya_sp.AAC.2